MNDLKRVVEMYRTNVSVDEGCKIALEKGDKLADGFDISEVAVLVFPRKNFNNAMMDLGMFTLDIDMYAGIMIPMKLDGVVFPLILIVDEKSEDMQKSYLVHELVHARQLNSMGLDEFMSKAHNFKGLSLAYLFNQLEREAYWEQIKWSFKNGFKKWRA